MTYKKTPLDFVQSLPTSIHNIIAFLAISAVTLTLISCGGGSSSGNGNSDLSSVSNSSLSTVITPPLVQNPECKVNNRVVIDANAPQLTLKGTHVTHIAIGGLYTDEGALANDNEDGDLTSNIMLDGISKLNTTVAGDYLLRYNVADKDGHSAKELHRIVRVHNDGDFTKYSLRPFNKTSAPAGYLEHLPTFYGDDPTQLYPLIIYAHGWGHFVQQSPQMNRLSTLLEGANIYKVFDDGLWPDSRPFIALEPQRCNNIGDNEWELVDQFIDWAIATYRVDPNKIYMTGLSAGGYFTYRYPVLYPHRVAAIVPMSAGAAVGNDAEIDAFCKAMEHMPVWAFHGDADDTVPLSSSGYTFYILRKDCAPSPSPAPLFTIIPNGDHVIANEVWNDTLIGQGRADSDIASISIYDWFLQYTLD